MSVGDIAQQSVWSVTRRSASVDWDKQLETKSEQNNRNEYTTKPMNGVNGPVVSRSRISRSLFGPTDPQENRRMAYDETNYNRSSDKKRWNFDFYREAPIAGRFEWKKVSNSNESLKSFGESGEQSDNFWSKKKSAKS